MPDYYKILNFFTQSLRIRMIEVFIENEYSKNEIRCPVHFSIGQEANAVALANALTKEDFMVSTHRCHAHYLAKGGSLDGFFGELYGKEIGCGKGRSGSMHLSDTSCGFLAATSIVGGTIPYGVGAAFASKLKGEKRLTAVCIGDAAIEEGVFHESANFAALHKLPVIFFMENNNYSCFTQRKDRQPRREFKTVAAAHGIEHIKLSWERFWPGVNMLEMAATIMRSRDAENQEPLFVECDAYRYSAHCGPFSDDNLNYRPKEEQLRYKSLDPIDQMERQMRADHFMNDEMLHKIKEKIALEIKDSFNRVQASPFPDKSELGKYLYA